MPGSPSSVREELKCNLIRLIAWTGAMDLYRDGSPLCVHVQ